MLDPPDPPPGPPPPEIPRYRSSTVFRAELGLGTTLRPTYLGGSAEEMPRLMMVGGKGGVGGFLIDPKSYPTKTPKSQGRDGATTLPATLGDARREPVVTLPR